jgi:hypothetical protein
MVMVEESSSRRLFYEIMQFASCHLREVVYNNSLISLTTLRVSSRCPVMIEEEAYQKLFSEEVERLQP